MPKFPKRRASLIREISKSFIVSPEKRPENIPTTMDIIDESQKRFFSFIVNGLFVIMRNKNHGFYTLL